MLFTVYKLVLHFLFPPGIFVVLSLGVAVLVVTQLRQAHERTRRARWRLRLAAALALIIGVTLYLASIEPVKDWLSRPLEDRYAPVDDRGILAADAIIVLGGGVHDYAPVSFARSRQEEGTPTPATLARLVEVVRIVNRLRELAPDRPLSPVIISGGSVYGDSRPEAEVDRRFLVSMGVPAERVIAEEQSRTTRENARQVSRICARRQLRRPLLVSTATHMPRAVLAFRQAGLEVIPAPADFVTDRAPYDLSSFFPDALRLSETRRALWEWTGLLVYKVF